MKINVSEDDEERTCPCLSQEANTVDPWDHCGSAPEADDPLTQIPNDSH